MRNVAPPQPRPQGFSLKKWVGWEKPWGRGWHLQRQAVLQHTPAIRKARKQHCKSELPP